MRFKPKTEREIAEAGLIEPGVYDFEVLEAEEATSKAGNDMIRLKLRVYDKDGAERIVFDYLMEQMAGKLRHAAEVCGLLEQYDNGEMRADDFNGKVGKVKLGIRKDKTGQYPDQNNVMDYVMGVSRPEHSTSTHKREMIDDDIPF